jgi:hypothetical protein
VSAHDKARLHAALSDLVERIGTSPRVRPPLALLREASTLEQILSRLLVVCGRRCLAGHAGTFEGREIEAGCTAVVVPFPGTWFLVTSQATYRGCGSFEDVRLRGTVVVRHVPALAPQTPSGSSATVLEAAAVEDAGVPDPAVVPTRPSSAFGSSVPFVTPDPWSLET